VQDATGLGCHGVSPLLTSIGVADRVSRRHGAVHPASAIAGCHS
jgi:hypothetical protein